MGSRILSKPAETRLPQRKARRGLDVRQAVQVRPKPAERCPAVGQRTLKPQTLNPINAIDPINPKS